MTIDANITNGMLLAILFAVSTTKTPYTFIQSMMVFAIYSVLTAIAEHHLL